MVDGNIVAFRRSKETVEVGGVPSKTKQGEKEMRTLTMMLLLFVFILMGTLCQAKPYFRFIDPAHPQISMGVFHDMKDGGSPAGASLALITHSPSDGCIIPGVCTSWTPLSLGGTTDRNSLAVGTSANILPVMRAFGKALLDLLTADTSFTNVKDILSDPKTGKPDITFAAGPQFALHKCGKDVCGFFPVFIGGAWNF